MSVCFSLSVCFLLLASDNSSLGAEEQYDAVVQAAFLGMVPPLSCAWHTTPQPATGCGYASLSKTTPTGSHSQLHTPGSDLQLAAVGKYQLYSGRQTSVIDLSKDMQKLSYRALTWHELKFMPLFGDILWPWRVKFNMQTAVKKRLKLDVVPSYNRHAKVWLCRVHKCHILKQEKLDCRSRLSPSDRTR